jgi:hypothetical protein
MTAKPTGCSLHKHPTYDEYLACAFGPAEAARVSIRLAQRDHHPDRRTTVTETTAKLAARKLNDEAGIPDTDAAQLWKLKGSKRVAIVELEAFERSEDVDDKHTVRLRVTHLELAPDGPVADLLRDLAKAAYKQRQPAPLDPEYGEETLDDVTRRGQTALQLVEEPANA